MKKTIITVILTIAFSAFAIQAVEQTAFKGAGIIESTTGGFMFPDGSLQASAVTPSCTAITYLPYVVLEEGVYCFTGNLETSMTSGYAIEIQSDNVVLDLNGWTLLGQRAPSATDTRGVFANNRKNLTIRNGTIQGFALGIQLFEAAQQESEGHLVEDIYAYGNTKGGIVVAGNGSIVRGNRVVNTGYFDSANSTVSGIFLAGSGGSILENQISGVSIPSGNSAAAGISVSTADGAVVSRNRIQGVQSFEPNSGYNIRVSLSDSVFVIENFMSGADKGVFYAGSSGKYRDNLTSDVTTPFTGGTDVGGND